MSHRHATFVMSHLRSLAAVHKDRTMSDRHLLERFIAEQDEAAFTALVAQARPLVFRVCRRVLQDWHASEDAFQATFLVLARQAGSIRKQQSLVGWLHGVAVRVSLKARGRSAKPLPAPRAVSVDEPAGDVTLRELRLVLDEELQRLPDRYAAPLVLCYLEGKTRDEAAQQLGRRVARSTAGWTVAGRCSAPGSPAAASPWQWYSVLRVWSRATKPRRFPPACWRRLAGRACGSLPAKRLPRFPPAPPPSRKG